MAGRDRSYGTADLRRTNARAALPWWARGLITPRRRSRQYRSWLIRLRAYLPRWDGRV